MVYLFPKLPKPDKQLSEASTRTHVKVPAIIPSAEFRLRLEPLLGVFQNRAQVLRPDREEAVGGCRAMSSGGLPPSPAYLSRLPSSPGIWTISSGYNSGSRQVTSVLCLKC